MTMTKAPSSTRIDKRALFRDIGYEPHPGQLEIHLSPAPRRIVACGVRWGKTLCAAMEGVAAALAPCERSVGWVVAPTYDLADRVFREIQLITLNHLRHRIVTMKEHERRIVIRNTLGDPVVVVADVGKGRVVFSGCYYGYSKPLSGLEESVFQSMLNWLGRLDGATVGCCAGRKSARTRIGDVR